MTQVAAATWPGKKQQTNVRVITQNIDGLHGRAGLPEEWAVEVHGRADLFKCATSTATRLQP